jgi:hypothetical protein
MSYSQKTALADFINTIGTELTLARESAQEGIPDLRKGLRLSPSDLKVALVDYHLMSAAFRTYRPAASAQMAGQFPGGTYREAPPRITGSYSSGGSIRSL